MTLNLELVVWSDGSIRLNHWVVGSSLNNSSTFILKDDGTVVSSKFLTDRPDDNRTVETPVNLVDELRRLAKG